MKLSELPKSARARRENKIRILFLVLCTFSFTAYAQDFPLPTPNPIEYGKIFDSRLEGFYQIHVVCTHLSRACDSSVYAIVDRLSIIDSHGRYGVSVTFGSKLDGSVTHTFFRATVGPLESQLSGEPSLESGGGKSTGPFAYFDISIDPMTEEVSGNLLAIRTAQEYSFTGRKIRSIADILKGSPPTRLTVPQILGTYHGVSGTLPGRLLVRLRHDGQLMGYFSSDSLIEGLPAFSLSFTMGSWDPDRGLLRLIFTNQLNSLGEVALSFRRKSPRGAIQLYGYEFSVFADNNFSMTREI